jgi:hypothetical protein
MKITELTKEELKSLVDSHENINQILITLGVNSNGSGAYRTFRNHCKRMGVETPMFTTTNREFRKRIPMDEILVENSTYSNNGRLKKRLVREGILEYVCVGCGNNGTWEGKDLTLQLDHINGINNDNRKENLRFLCPNCHTQTNTYGSKNLKKKHYCECGAEKAKRSDNCQTCSKIKQRKVERPSQEQLIKEIEELGYCGVGRKYGVSDNAIRKWVKH